MITLEDMQVALAKAHGEKVEVQARLRMAAAELVKCYRESLGLSGVQGQAVVCTGTFDGFDFVATPVVAMEINGRRTLEFYLSTTLQDRRISKFVVSVSISLREKDEFISVTVENDKVPVLILKEGVEARFAEVVEVIKAEVLRKIEYLA